MEHHFAENTCEYPFNKAAAAPELLKNMGKGQPKVKDGIFAIKDVPLSRIAENRDAVVKLLDEMGFDK